MKRYVLHGGPSTIYGRTAREVWRSLRVHHDYGTARLLFGRLQAAGHVEAKWGFWGRAGALITAE